MAFNDTESLDLTETLPDAGSPSAVNRRYKSFKRKYGKQKIKFEFAMREGNSLVKEEMRILNLSKRLREQNDQLLELLLELNSTIHIPPTLRYGLEVKESSPLRLSPEPSGPSFTEYDAQIARDKLKDANEKLLAGEMTAEECRVLEQSMLESDTFAPSQQITSLRNVPHTIARNDDHISTESDMDSTLGFTKPEDEIDYSGTLDSVNLNSRLADKEKEAASRNPVSVYNWLRKHQPQVFTHDGEPQSEKPPASRTSGTRTSKRAPAPIPKEEDLYDEDGILMDIAEPSGGTTNRNKRKRDDDGVYHPKSGTNNRSRRRRDEKRSKKPPATAPTA